MTANMWKEPGELRAIVKEQPFVEQLRDITVAISKFKTKEMELAIACLIDHAANPFLVVNSLDEAKAKEE